MASFRGRLWFCSNFYPVTVHWHGIDFPTSEHVYVWEKVAHRPDLQALVQMARTPAEAKRIGKGNARPGWTDDELTVMHNVLRAKFRDSQVRAALLATGQEPLVEVNEWHDTFWGVCDGVGKNWLGRLLMAVRAECRAAEDTTLELMRLAHQRDDDD